MKFVLCPSRRIRRRIALLAILSLLFQQVALASYLCSPADMPAGSVAMNAHCDGMPMVNEEAPAKAASPALCAQHCSPQTLTTQDARLPSVPPLLLPALLPTPPMAVVSPARVAAARDGADARRTPGLSPALRYQVLLI